MQHDLP
jgi:hypothetical protein